MGCQMLFKRAYELCVKCSRHSIAHDLAYMTKGVLVSEIGYLTQFQGG